MMDTKKRFAKFKNIEITSKIFIALLIIFTLFSAYFATRLNRAIIPDETRHFLLSQQYSTSLWSIPPITPTTFAFGQNDHSQFLYYWINGRVLNILNLLIPSISSWKQLVVLRLISVVYSVLTLIFCYLLAKEIIKNSWCQLLVVFMLSNTLMFVFLSGGVNYDNLTNLCCTASTLFLVRVFTNKPFYRNSLLWLIFICLGTLIKITILPLAGIMFTIWLYYVWMNREKIQFHPVWDKKILMLVIFLIILVVCNLGIHGENLIKYKTISPECTQILTIEQCNSNYFFARDSKAKLPEKITMHDILSGGYTDLFEYVTDFWGKAMLTKIYGIMGHKVFYPDTLITFFQIFYLWIVFIIVRCWKKPTFAVGGIFFIALSYILVLLIFNYNSELVNGFQHYAIQGRYIFPVIGIVYSLVVYYLSHLQNRFIRRMSYVSTVILFLISCPVNFLTHYATDFTGWFYPL